MAYDKVVDSAKLDAAMTATANAIRAKRGSAGMISWDEQNGYADAVNALPDAIEEVDQATPSISVSSGGLITASATQAAGKVAAGTKSATKQLTTQGEKTITPSTSEQVAVEAGVYTTGRIIVEAAKSADYNFFFVLFDGTRLTGEEIETMRIPQGEVAQIQNGNGEILWEYTPPPIDPVLDNNSWHAISVAGQSGIASSMWSVGDRKSILVNGKIDTISINTTYFAYIIGFNHNGSTGIDFGTFKTALSGGIDVCLTGPTNGTSNVGGWKSCRLRYTVLGSTNTLNEDAGELTAKNPVANTLMAALPSDLRNVMKPMTIYTDNVGGSSNAAGNVTATIDYLPLMSEYEVHASSDYANPAEKNYQAQYSYYAAGNSKMKYSHNALSSSINWWNRSPTSYSGNSMFCCTSLWGFSHATVLNAGIGTAPIFRV